MATYTVIAVCLPFSNIQGKIWLWWLVQACRSLWVWVIVYGDVVRDVYWHIHVHGERELVSYGTTSQLNSELSHSPPPLIYVYPLSLSQAKQGQDETWLSIFSVGVLLVGIMSILASKQMLTVGGCK